MENEGEMEVVFESQHEPQAAPKPQGLKKSTIWKYFEETTDSKISNCKVCGAKLSRGGVGKSASTTPLRRHLQFKHVEEFEILKSEENAKLNLSTRPLNQPTIKAVIQNQNQNVWKKNDERAIDLHYAIAEMIAVDNQPYSFVEDEGFKRLLKKAQPRYTIPGRKFFSNNIVPDIYRRCKEVVKTRVETARFFSFTTDTWSTNYSNESFISHTAHWVQDDFSATHAVLGTKHFPGAHTAEAISTLLITMLTDWNIEHPGVHLILSGNAANMVKGVKDTQLPHESCFLHTLQLVITDAMNSQRMVHDMLAASRNIVSHFNHSPLSSVKFKNIQKQLGMKTNKLLQDVCTRWNSSYYMLHSIYEQKRSITVFASEEPGKIANLNENQWVLLESTLSLLKPFEEITKIISQIDSCISEVIPATASLQLYLEKQNELHKGVGTMKDELKKSISRRLSHIFEDKNYTVATYVDPRFKLAFFPANMRDTVTRVVLEEMTALSPEIEINLSSEGPPPKKSLPDIHSLFWSCYSEIQESVQDVCETNTSDANNFQKTALESENKLYASTPLLDRKESPFTWWGKNQAIYPNLAQVARKFLSAPASTICSERLFSEAGNIYENKRNRLTPQHGESLTFLHHNLKLIDFNY